MGNTVAKKKVGIKLKDADVWETAHTFLTMMGQGYQNSKDAQFDTIEFDKPTVVEWYNKLVPDLYDLIEWGLDKSVDKPTKKVQFECPKKNLSKDAMVKILGLEHESKFDKISYEDMKKNFDSIKQYFDYTKKFEVACPGSISQQTCDDKFVRDAYFKNCASFNGDNDGLTDQEEREIRREIEDLTDTKETELSKIEEEYAAQKTALESAFELSKETIEQEITEFEIQRFQNFAETRTSILNEINTITRSFERLLSNENSKHSRIKAILKYKHRETKVLFLNLLNNKIKLEEIKRKNEISDLSKHLKQDLQSEAVNYESKIDLLESTAEALIAPKETTINNKLFEIFKTEVQRDIDIASKETEIQEKEDEILDLENQFEIDKNTLETDHNTAIADLEAEYLPQINTLEQEISDLETQRQALIDAGVDTSDIDAQIAEQKRKLDELNQKKKDEFNQEEIRFNAVIASINDEYDPTIADEQQILDDLIADREQQIEDGVDTTDIDQDIADKEAEIENLENQKAADIADETTRHEDSWTSINAHWETVISDIEQQIIDLLAQREQRIQDEVDTSDVDEQLAELEKEKTDLLLVLRKEEFDERKRHADRVVYIVSNYIDRITTEENIIKDLEEDRETAVANGEDTTDIDADIAEHKEILENYIKNRDYDLLVERQKHEQIMADLEASRTESQELNDLDDQIADLLIQRQAIEDGVDTSDIDDQIADLEVELDQAKADREAALSVEFNDHNTSLDSITDLDDQIAIAKEELEDLLQQREDLINQEIDLTDIDAEIAAQQEVVRLINDQKQNEINEAIIEHSLILEAITEKYTLQIESVLDILDELNETREELIDAGVDTSVIDAQIVIKKTELNNLKEEYNLKVKEENDAYDQALDDLNEALANDIAPIKILIANLKQDILDIKETARNVISALNDEIKVLKTEINDINSSLNLDKKTESDDYYDIINTIRETYNNAVKAVNVSYDEIIDGLTDQKDSAETAYQSNLSQDLAEEMTRHNNANDRINGNIEKLRPFILDFSNDSEDWQDITNGPDGEVIIPPVGEIAVDGIINTMKDIRDAEIEAMNDFKAYFIELVKDIHDDLKILINNNSTDEKDLEDEFKIAYDSEETLLYDTQLIDALITKTNRLSQEESLYESKKKQIEERRTEAGEERKRLVYIGEDTSDIDAELIQINTDENIIDGEHTSDVANINSDYTNTTTTYLAEHNTRLAKIQSRHTANKAAIGDSADDKIIDLGKWQEEYILTAEDELLNDSADLSNNVSDKEIFLNDTISTYENLQSKVEREIRDQQDELEKLKKRFLEDLETLLEVTAERKTTVLDYYDGLIELLEFKLDEKMQVEVFIQQMLAKMREECKDENDKKIIMPEYDDCGNPIKEEALKQSEWKYSYELKSDNGVLWDQKPTKEYRRKLTKEEILIDLEDVLLDSEVDAYKNSREVITPNGGLKYVEAHGKLLVYHLEREADATGIEHH